MLVGLLQEGEIPTTSGSAAGEENPFHRRYHEMIQEVVLADRVGFSSWGTSEQHFSPPRFTVSAPDVLYAAVAAKTERITIRNMAAVLLSWNHPITVVERLATLDIVSNGRAELTTARSNNKWTLDAFGVEAKDTKAQWRDGMEVIVKALNDPLLSHDGPYWRIPEREIVPRSLQTPHPALSVAASGIDSHEEAGQKGLGVISFDNYFGWDYLADCVEAYRKGLANCQPLSSVINDYFGVFVPSAFCAPTREEAYDVARETALGYFNFIIDLYRPMANQPSYAYMGKVVELLEHSEDFQWLLDASPSVIVGTPDDLVASLSRLSSMGVDEVVLRVDGFGHDHHLRAIELIGEQVIPRVASS